MNKKYKTSGFFSGVGGIELGFEQTGGFELVQSNEIDQFAAITLSLNFKHELLIKDIRKLEINELEDSEIFVAGFPCQAFSVAGYQKGFEDDRGTLYFDLLRLIIATKPRVVFLENVKNLYHHDNGNTFRVIKESLEFYGYHLKSDILNAKDFGNIPQNRERIYIVAFLDKQDCDNFEFPKPIELSKGITDMLEQSVDQKYIYSQDKYDFMKKLESVELRDDRVYQWRRIYLRENKSSLFPTLTANMGTGGHNVPLVFNNENLRKLTPRECFNVQGYPKKFELPNIADAHLYKQAGNSVVVPVIRRIAENIYNALIKTDKGK